MHYKNGREAKAGDMVVRLSEGPYDNLIAGVLHSVSAGSETCNGYIRPVGEGDYIVTISECLHIADIMAADIPDSSK